MTFVNKSNPEDETAVLSFNDNVTLEQNFTRKQNDLGRALSEITYRGSTALYDAAYQAAKEIPEILSQLPCFCSCMDNLGHKNNLYCFSDNHGNICDMCQNIALDAQEMHKKGMPVSQIRDKIRAAYSDGRM